MDDKIVKGIIIGIIIVAIVAIVLILGTRQQTITGFHNPVVNTYNSQFQYNIYTLTPIRSISVNFSVSLVPGAIPADGIQIILGSDGVRFVGGPFLCSSQGNFISCNPIIQFSGIMAGIELAALPRPVLFICPSKGQCYTTPIPLANMSGTLTVNVSSNITQATLQLSNGSVYTLFAPLGVKTNLAEVSVTTGAGYAIWNLNSITIKSSII